MANWRFDVCLTVIAFTTMQTPYEWTLCWVLQQMLKMSSISLHVLCQPLSKARGSIVLRKISHVFSSATANSETVFWHRMKLSKMLRALLPDMISIQGGVNLKSKVTGSASSYSFHHSYTAESLRSLLLLFRLDDWALSVIATATWLGGWLGVRHTPVLYQNG